VDLAGEAVLLKPLVCFKSRHATMFKATSTVTSTQRHSLEAGKPVPFSLQYKKGETYDEISEVTEPNVPVYYRKFISMISAELAYQMYTFEVCIPSSFRASLEETA
jgi:hypothetical protein